jgi:hypothetical protein
MMDDDTREVRYTVQIIQKRKRNTEKKNNRQAWSLRMAACPDPGNALQQTKQDTTGGKRAKARRRLELTDLDLFT